MDPRRLAAVLVDPHPTLWAQAATESELLARLQKVGPLPQADLFEPWEASDPWRARVRVPGVDPGRCLSVGELVNGDPPGRVEWVDCGRVGEDCIELEGAVARCVFDHQGGLLFPDLRELEDPVDDVLARFSAGVGGRSLVWVQAVAHRETGRPGYRFTAQVPDLDPSAERLAVFEAVLGCGSFAPDLLWWFELGRVVVVAWRIHARLPGLPADAGFGWSSSLDGWQGRTELQVAVDPAHHDQEVLQLADSLGPKGFMGARPRWIGDRFVACWEGEAGCDVDVECRRVPGCPVGLEERWLGIDPRWWPGHLVRYRCGLLDRDLLPRCTSREADDTDRTLIALFGGFMALDPVQADVPALRLVLPALDARSWRMWVERFQQVQHPALASVHYVAMGQDFTLLLRRKGEAEPVVWGPPR